MLNRLVRLSFTCLATLSIFVAARGEVYSTTDGRSFDGRIYKVLEGVVYLKVGEEKVEEPIDSFDAAAKAAIDAWVAENPFAVDVHTKWDVQPRIISSSMPVLPEQFLGEEFKGMVSVDLVLSEEGRVIFAAVNKSTHADLETPSLEAAKNWVFEPAEVGGKSVRSKLRVPFRFVNTPPPPAEGEEPSA